MNPPDPRVGLVVTATYFDPKTHRSRCGQCSRIIATGQAACVCGARFVGTARA